jgi:hypothetical protein
LGFPVAVDPSNSLDASQKLGVRLPTIRAPFEKSVADRAAERDRRCAALWKPAATLPSRFDLSPSAQEAGPRPPTDRHRQDDVDLCRQATLGRGRPRQVPKLNPRHSFATNS